MPATLQTLLSAPCFAQLPPPANAAQRLRLEPPQTNDPFSAHPQLTRIWPAASQALAQEATLEALAMAQTHDIGGLYLMWLDQQVVGMTGFFFVDSAEEPFLRWHGVVPEHRSQGLSAAALRWVLLHLLSRYPLARGLTELVPQTSYAAGIERHFQSMGFEKTGALERYDWSPHLWQPYRLALK